MKVNIQSNIYEEVIWGTFLKSMAGKTWKYG